MCYLFKFDGNEIIFKNAKISKNYLFKIWIFSKTINFGCLKGNISLEWP
jgi:hypothetical protein